MQLPDIRNVEELIRLAAALEQRAAARFRSLAERMQADGRDDLSALFERLAGDEEAHLKALLTSAAQKEIDMEPDVAMPLDAMGEGGALPDAAELARATVYECLADAVRNEEKAFAFFSYVAAHAEDELLMIEAEALAKEELAHAALLRQARREAYHQRPPASKQWPNPASIRDLQDFRRVAASGEADIAGQLAILAQGLPQCETLSAEAARMSASLSSLPSRPLDARPERQDGEPDVDEALLESALDHAEEAFAFYDAVASSTEQEDVMLRAQELSAHAVDRLCALRNISA